MFTRMKKRKYRRLSGREREEISRGLASGAGMVEIATRIGRDRGTVSREVGRNSGRSGYRAFSARNRARASASSRKLGKRILAGRAPLREYVTKKSSSHAGRRSKSSRLSKGSILVT